MNAPRLVLQSAIAGSYGALSLALVVRAAGPAAPGGPFAWLPIVAVYTAAAAVIWPLLYGATRFFASRSLSVPRFSLRYVMSFHVANGVPLLLSIGVLVGRGHPVLAPEVDDRLRFFLGGLFLAWAYAAVVCIVPPLKRSAVLQASAAGLALAALLAPGLRAGRARAAPHGPPSPVPPIAGRLLLLDFDGADLEDVLSLQAEGKLPAFQRLSREGAYGRLVSLRPCVAAVTRATLVTGQLPFRSGVRGAFVRDLLGRPSHLMVIPPGLGFDLLLAPFMTRRVAVPDDRRSPALWDIAARAGGRARAAGWDLDLDLVPARESSPRDPADPLARRIRAEFLDEARSVPDPTDSAAGDDLVRAYGADEAVRRVLEEDLAGGAPPPGVTALSFPGLDHVAHRFLPYARPAAFGNVSPSEVERYGPVLARYYARVDAIVGRALQARGADGWLFVTSTHGMEPAPLAGRLIAAAASREGAGGVHDGAPGGFLFALGPGVRAGTTFGRASLLDVTPTALFVLGLPITRDLDGSIVEQILDPGELAERPAIVIDSYGPRP